MKHTRTHTRENPGKKGLRHDPHRHHLHARIICPRRRLDHQPGELSSGDRPEPASPTQHEL